MYKNAFELAEIVERARQFQYEAYLYGMEYIKQAKRPVTTAELANVTGLSAREWAGIFRSKVFRWEALREGFKFVPWADFTRYYQFCDAGGCEVPNRKLYSRTKKFWAVEYIGRYE